MGRNDSGPTWAIIATTAARLAYALVAVLLSVAWAERSHLVADISTLRTKVAALEMDMQRVELTKFTSRGATKMRDQLRAEMRECCQQLPTSRQFQAGGVGGGQ